MLPEAALYIRRGRAWLRVGPEGRALDSQVGVKCPQTYESVDPDATPGSAQQYAKKCPKPEKEPKRQSVYNFVGGPGRNCYLAPTLQRPRALSSCRSSASVRLLDRCLLINLPRGSNVVPFWL